MEDLKKNIIGTASQLFFQKGCRSVSMDDVCAELRISKKTVYHYFPKKEALIESVIENFQFLQYHGVEKMMAEMNSIDFFISMTKHIRKSIDNQSFVFWDELKKYYPKLHQRMEEEQKEFTKKVFITNLERGMEEGYFRTDLDIELLSLFHSVQIKNTFEMMRESSSKFSNKRLVDFFIDMMNHLITNEKGLKYIKEKY